MWNEFLAEFDVAGKYWFWPGVVLGVLIGAGTAAVIARLAG